MGLVEEIGNKSAGELIRAADWNTLVAAVAQLVEDLGELRSDFDDKLAPLAEDLAELRGEFDDLKTAVAPLLQAYRVTLTTTRPSYAVGELVELTARVTLLSGQAVTDRPWVDFVSTWGSLRAASGFEARSGLGSRSLSVRTDSQGVARAILRADPSGRLSALEEEEVASAMSTRQNGTGASAAQLILQAATPAEATQNGAFQIVGAAYKQGGRRTFQKYVDTVYKYGQHSLGELHWGEAVGTTWNDYYVTVMAFARADADPTTPDHSRGVNSIQITFREWVYSWGVLDILDEAQIEVIAVDLLDELKPTIRDDYVESIVRVKKKVDDLVRDKGLLERQSTMAGIVRAMGRIEGEQAFLPQLTDAVQKAVSIQQSLDLTQTAAPFAQSELVAFDVFSEAATRADTNVAGVIAEIAAVDQRVGQTGVRIDQIAGQLGTLTAQIGDVGREARGGIDGLRQQLVTFQGATQISLNDLLSRSAQVTESIGQIRTQIGVLDERTFELGRRGDTIRNEVDFVKNQFRDFQGVDAGTFNAVEGKVQALLGDVVNLKRQIGGR